MKIRVLLYNIEKPEEWMKSFLNNSPAFLPRPEFIFVEGDKIECDETYPYLIISEKPIKLQNCFSLWSPPDITKAIMKAIELSYSQPSEAVTRRTLLTGKKALSISKVPLIDETLCLSKFGCNRCELSCPQKAITMNNGIISINPNNCNLCGICTTACPKGAITLTYPTWKAIAFISDYLLHTKLDKVTIGCSDETDIVLPTLNVLGFEELLSLISTGVKVEFNCEREKDLANKLSEIVSKISSDIHEKALSQRIGVKRKDYVKIVNETKLEVNYGKNIFDLKINDNCTVCGACMYRCPERAIIVEYNQEGAFLYFNPQNCTGCEKCVKICAEKAIELTEVSETSKLFIDKELKAKDETVKCKRCGRPFDNKKHLLKVAQMLNIPEKESMYCPECRAQLNASKIVESFRNKKLIIK
ncbi:MAG: 4Fe-4S binding protein [Sulfolobus sp.]|nr:4Fe-4S binding protein [Sulfolobus sp.]